MSPNHNGVLTWIVITFYEPSLREAAKKNFLMAGRVRPYPLPPCELNDSRNFFFLVLKQAKTGFNNFFPSHNFWSKRAIFCAKYCNKPDKDYDFANIASIGILICRHK